jgi:hypothetical protein
VNFIHLAELEGLELVGHERVIATVGPNEMDAGTHVFTLHHRPTTA